ncbi:hypothetical protein PPERSA_02565 [Pseudocohnilembus persalinus]|uniref:Uncharacterized protein n=1 Tax=Pseudocohnilembus persalinus TaxID=266149 RepID=A0A0V0R5B7_PSEPJ|nr:hypothetical protein PPERSA_02565 [Pseudocohnilembus persalinus]|eukprot:KRX09693.1 hypothetical protein PPERSA_02565 [Pseudocohnilembus persalinus]
MKGKSPQNFVFKRDSAQLESSLQLPSFDDFQDINNQTQQSQGHKKKYLVARQIDKQVVEQEVVSQNKDFDQIDEYSDSEESELMEKNSNNNKNYYNKENIQDEQNKTQKNQQNNKINIKAGFSNNQQQKKKNQVMSLNEQEELYGIQNNFKNIFIDAKSEAAKYGLDKPGAKYDSDGKIIQRSLVGNPEWYQKYSNLNRNRISLLGKTQMSNKQKKKSAIAADNQSVRSQLKEKNKANSQYAMGKYQSKTEIVSKLQLIQQLKEAENRIEESKQLEEQEVKKLPLEKRLIYESNQKILNRHLNQEKVWEKQIENSSNKLNRDYSFCNILRADDYWLKTQTTGIFDEIKTDYERFGSNVWINGLREYEAEKLKEKKRNKNARKYINDEEDEYEEKKQQAFSKIRFVQDIPEAFKSSQIGGKFNKVQIIKRPMLTDPTINLQMKKQGNSMTQSQFNIYCSDNYNDTQNTFQSQMNQQNYQSQSNLNLNNHSTLKGRQMHKSQSSLSFMGNTTLNINMNPFQNASSSEYYFKKLNESKLDKYEPLFSQNTDFENLGVQGKSKLSLEAEYLNKFENASLFNRFKKTEEDKKAKIQDEEIIEINYDKRNKLNNVYTDMSKKLDEKRQENLRKKKQEKLNNKDETDSWL